MLADTGPTYHPCIPSVEGLVFNLAAGIVLPPRAKEAHDYDQGKFPYC